MCELKLVAKWFFFAARGHQNRARRQPWKMGRDRRIIISTELLSQMGKL